jgi:hypothetical protein
MKRDTEHNDTQINGGVAMLSVVYAECRQQTHYAECRHAECRYAECHYDECHGAEVYPWREQTCSARALHALDNFAWA